MLPYHPEVCTAKQLVQGSTCGPRGCSIPIVPVSLIESVRLLPHQCMAMTVVVDAGARGSGPVMIEGLSESAILVEDALVHPDCKGLVYVLVSNPSGVSLKANEESCVGEVSETKVVEPVTNDCMVRVVSPRAEREPDGYSQWRKQRLIGIVGKPDLLSEPQMEEFIDFLGCITMCSAWRRAREVRPTC